MFKYVFAFAFAFFLLGCSATWNGIKDDTSHNWNATKRAVHNATD